MKKVLLYFKFFSILIIILPGFSIYGQGISVLTQRYDTRRSGWNSHDTTLNTINVNPREFGLLFTRPVDDQIYAQPLLVSNIEINGIRQNLVYVATVNNTLYAFNASDSVVMDPIWHRNLTPAGARAIKNTDMTGACGGSYFDFSGNMGIVGTPVIDTNTLTMFIVTRDITNAGNHFEQYLHAINIKTGAEKSGSPVFITAKVKGNGEGSVNDTVSFDEQKENQRPGLLLFNGVVYVAWASHCDWEPYHGWIIGFDTATLQKRYIFNDTPDGIEGGIWMSGTGPSVDENGYLYVVTGNGTVGKGGDPNNLRNRGESLLKMIPSGDSLKIVDFFTPSNYQQLENSDLDYGIDGPVLIPNSTLSVSGSKDGVLYLLNNNSMGRYSANNDSLLQLIHITNNHNDPSGFIHGTPVYYRYFSAVDTECLYVWGSSDSLTQYFFNRNLGKFDLSRTIRGTHPLNIQLPGAMLSVSSKDTAAATGILWASHPSSGDANHDVRPGTLEAYDARDVRKLLWSSDSGAITNNVGTFAKFNTPIVANGKVYEATFSNKLDVYGLYKTPLPPPVSVEQKENITGFSLSPNPAHESVRLTFFLSRVEKKLELKVLDLSGRQVLIYTMIGQLGANSVTLDIETRLQPGVYTITVQSDVGVEYTAKLAKY
jgi:hypothetical protein